MYIYVHSKHRLGCAALDVLKAWAILMVLTGLGIQPCNVKFTAPAENDLSQSRVLAKYTNRAGTPPFLLIASIPLM